MSVAAHDLLLSSLTTHYDRHPRHRDALHDIINGLSPLSLRTIDWFITHYARANPVTYWVDTQTNTMHVKHPLNGERHLKKFVLFVDYRAQLKAFSKMYFDAFRRNNRITFVLEKRPFRSIETTVGQLNFFRWALNNCVIDHILSNLANVEHTMLRCNRIARNCALASSTRESAASMPVQQAVVRAQCHIEFD